MRIASSLLLAALLAPPTAARTGAPADAHAIVRQLVQAHGGRAAIGRVHAYRLEGETFSAMRHVNAPIVRVWAEPNRFKTLIDYETSPEARLVDGDDVWRNDPGGPLAPAAGPMRGAVVLQAARAAVPWILAERESLAVAIEPLERDGLKLPGIEIPVGKGLRLRAWIHPATHLVMASQGLLEGGGMATHFETYYSDYRRVGALRFAFHEENWSSGMQTGETRITRVVLDPALAPDAFRPPPGGDAHGD